MASLVDTTKPGAHSSTCKRLDEVVKALDGAPNLLAVASVDIRLLRQTLDDIACEMIDRIDGGTDGPAIDGWLSEKLRLIEWVLTETR